MTPQEQIAWVRDSIGEPAVVPLFRERILAVCDLAERALLTDEEAEAVRRFEAWTKETGDSWPVIVGILRRLLPAPERVEHRLVNITQPVHQDRPGAWWVLCSCGEDMSGDTLHDAIALAAAHAGIGGLMGDDKRSGSEHVAVTITGTGYVDATNGLPGYVAPDRDAVDALVAAARLIDETLAWVIDHGERGVDGAHPACPGCASDAAHAHEVLRAALAPFDNRQP